VEATAIELDVWLTQVRWHDTCIKLHCDNSSIITAFWKGHFWNPACNESLYRISSTIAAAILSIDPDTFNLLPKRLTLCHEATQVCQGFPSPTPVNP